MQPFTLWTALLVVAATSAVALAAPSEAATAESRFIRTGVSEDDDNYIKQVYYEASAPGSTDVQLHQGVTQAEQLGAEVAVGPTQAPAPISISGIMSSVWDLVVSWVRGLLGLQRHDPPRLARAILGAAAGDAQCWRTTACQAGRLLRGLHEKEFVFIMMERLSPQQWKGVVKGMRRAAMENEDCRKYECDS